MMGEPRRGRGAVRGPQTRPPRSDETSGEFLPALPPFLPSRPLFLRSHGLQVRLLSTRRGPVQSENLSSGTSGDRNRLREDGIYHDVNTLPALTDYHERPRRASRTRSLGRSLSLDLSLLSLLFSLFSLFSLCSLFSSFSALSSLPLSLSITYSHGGPTA